MRNIKMYRCGKTSIVKNYKFTFNYNEIKLLCDLINERYERLMKKHKPDMSEIERLNDILEKLVSEVLK